MDFLIKLKDYSSKIKKKFILNEYYIRRIKDGKSLGASFMDWFFISLIIGLFFYITIFNSIQNFVITILLTGLLLFIYVFLLIYVKRKVKKKNILKINEEIGEEQIRRRIEKYKDDEFCLFIKDILEKYYDVCFFQGYNGIDFIGEINGERYGIKCIKSSWDDKIYLKDINYFIEAMREKNIGEGIIVTNAYFDEDVKENTDYLLIDFNHIKNILKKIDIFPTNEEIENLIISEHKARKKDLKENFKTNRKEKIYKFLLLGLALYIVSSYVAYPLYYKIMAFISFALGIFIGVYNLAQYMRSIRENRL